MPPKVALIGTRYPDLAIEERELGPLGVELVTGDGLTPDDLVAEARDADVIIAGARPRFDGRVLAMLEARGIVRAGIGVDSVDLAAARARGIWVVNVPDYGTEAVALHTMALILAGLRRLTAAHGLVLAGRWSVAELGVMRLPSSLTLGIVGLGRIGRRVVDLARPAGFREMVASDPAVAEAPPGCRLVPFDELIASSDVVTLHAPGPSGGDPLIGPAQIGAMREGALLVNTARGSLVDLPALSEGLAGGRPGWAALDVFLPEPPDLDVLRPVADRLTLTPHLAWYTEETQAELRKRSAEEAARILRGERPRNMVVGPE